MSHLNKNNQSLIETKLFHSNNMQDSTTRDRPRPQLTIVQQAHYGIFSGLVTGTLRSIFLLIIENIEMDTSSHISTGKSGPTLSLSMKS